MELGGGGGGGGVGGGGVHCLIMPIQNESIIRRKRLDFYKNKFE